MRVSAEKGYHMKKLILLLVVCFVLAACASTQPAVKPVETIAQATTAVQNAPSLDGAAILENQCAQCHSPEKAKQAPRSRDQWSQTVDRMINKGAVLSGAEKTALVDYLAKNYGK
jgi:cytochrome c5